MASDHDSYMRHTQPYLDFTISSLEVTIKHIKTLLISNKAELPKLVGKPSFSPSHGTDPRGRTLTAKNTSQKKANQRKLCTEKLKLWWDLGEARDERLSRILSGQWEGGGVVAGDAYWSAPRLERDV